MNKKKFSAEQGDWMADRLSAGYALHEIVTDKTGKPVDYIFLRVNRAFEKITGLKARHVTEKKVTSVMPGIKKDRKWIDLYGEIALKGGDRAVEWYSEALNKWFNVYAYSPIKGLFVTIFTDITPAKEAAEDARKKQELAERYVELAGSIVIALDAGGKIIFANEKCCELTGFKKEEIRGIDWIQRVVPARDRKKLKKALAAVSAGKALELEKNENPVIDKAGRERLVSWRNSVIRDEQGRFISVLSIGDDITELRKAEKTISERAAHDALRAEIWRIALSDTGDEKALIKKVLRTAGPVLGADRLSYNEVRKDKLVCAFEWRKKGIAPSVGSSLPVRVVDLLLKGAGVFQLDLQSALVAVGKAPGGFALKGLIKAYAASLNLKAVMFMPFYVKNEYVGMITSDLCAKSAHKEKFTAEEESLLAEVTAIARLVMERRKSEEDVRKSGLWFRRLFESAPDAYYLNDMNGIFVDGNEAAEKMLGYDKKELIGKDFRKAGLLPFSSLGKAVKMLLSNKAGRPTPPEEFEMKRKDGKTVFAEITTRPVEIEGRKLVLGIARDVTQKRKDEAEMRQREEKYRAVFNSSREMLFIIELGKGGKPEKIIDVNDSAVSVLGFSGKELLEKRISDFDTEGMKGINPVKIMASVIRDGYAVMERSLITKNGEIVPVEFTAKTFITEGKRVGFISARDLRAELAAKREITEREKKYRGLFDTVNDAAILYEADGTVVEVNEAAVRMTGFTKEQLQKSKIGLFARGDGKNNWPDEKTETGSRSFESSVKNVSGRLVPVEVNARVYVQGQKKYVLAMARDITERSAAKAKLEMDARILDAVTDSIFVYDAEGSIIYVNSAACVHLGRRKDELLGKNITDVVFDPSDAAEARERVKKIMKQGDLVFEVEHTAKGGRRIPVEVHSKKTTISGQDIIISAVRDITERKEAERELRRLFFAVEQSPASVVITDSKGNIEYVNRKFCEVTGYTEEEVKGKNPRILKSGETAEHEYTRMWAAISSGSGWRGEFHNKKKNGEYFWESASISPLMAEKGVISGYIAIKEDITEMKEIAKKMNENREMLADFLENANDLIQIVNPEGGFIYVNKAWKSALGYGDKDVSGLKIFDIISPARKNHCKELFARIKEGECENFIETVFITKDGREIYVEGSASCRFEGGRPVSTRAIFRDVTAKRETELRLQESYENLKKVNILKSNFISMVSHELRTPITSIKGFTSFLQKGVAGAPNERQSEFLDTIANNTDRLLNLINDLLDSSKIESGTFKIEKAEADITAAAADAVKEISPLAQKKNIRIEHVIEGAGSLFAIDSHRINQVIINLINNAIKFSKDGDVILVEGKLCRPDRIKVPEYAGGLVFPKAEYFCFSVKDSGIGMNPEELTRIFERYYQVSGTDKPIFKGLGLGLNISKTIVEAHGGKIWAESDGPGKGSRFVFAIPDLREEKK